MVMYSFLLFLVLIIASDLVNPLPDKALKDMLDQVLLSGYFDQTSSHQNGVCEEEEEDEPAAVAASAPVAESSEAEEQPVDPGNDLCFASF